MMMAMAVAACGVEQATPTCAEIGAPDTLLCARDGACSYEGQACTQTAPSSAVPIASRLDACGAAPSEPAVAPAEITDSAGEQFVIIEPRAWTSYADYMTASKAWADCMVYGAKS
jgi:hypothetical protein